MENISIESSNVGETGEKTDKIKKDKDCVELKNLEYKNVLMYGNNLKPKDESVNVSVLEELLEKQLEEDLTYYSKCFIATGHNSVTISLQALATC